MIKKVFRPFWSHDIEKIETWLSTMARQGYHVVKINRMTNYFFFEKGASKAVNYHIGYDKMFDTLPETLINDGWEQLFKQGNWYVIANQKPSDEIKTTLVRDGVIKHNWIVMFVVGGVSLYITFPFLIFLVTISIRFMLPGNVHVESSPFWVFTVLFWMIGILGIYSTVKRYKANKRMSGMTMKQRDKTIPSRMEEKHLKKAGEIIIKRKVAWQYSPDKLENWLKKMENQGYHLYRVSKWGIKFYFAKGEPRKVSYCLDYQNNLNQNYFDMHKEAGWKLNYTNNSFLSKWSIWSRVYEDGEVEPQLYSDDTHMIKHAKRVMITYLSMFVPVTVLYLMVIILNINLLQRNGMDTLRWSTLILYGIVILEFGTFAVKSLLYYRRVKNKVNYS
ncbi:DUF2812 domain-containing protein [Oceanobacillus rekensis]|uniref:DUF2812 domain-containing protein n=1 Tax=Oceanobacillus rekensis TaxID=937927 RepID=UPI000B45489D|nr:DUF2812 domain-containing protein [Oceanobacillus rekensis]